VDVAVTGATGFLGGHLCEALLHAGHGVRALVRSPDRAAPLRARDCAVHRADVLEPDSLRQALHGADALIANAALGSWQGDLQAMHRVNVEGVEHSLRAAASRGLRRVVLISSVAVYQTRLGRPMDEQAPGTDPERRRWAWRDLTTDWRYAMTKTRGEHRAWALARELDLELTTVRPGPVYGPGDPKLTARLLGALDRRLAVLPTAGIPLVHARDVADAVVVALHAPASIGRAYNLAGPPSSPAAMVRTLRQVAGRGPVILPVPVPVAVRFDCSAAARDLAFRPRPLRQGLTSVLDAPT